MIIKIFGIAPKLESDGSYSPSKLVLRISVPNKTDFEKIRYKKYNVKKSKILVICIEEKILKYKMVKCSLREIIQ